MKKIIEKWLCKHQWKVHFTTEAYDKNDKESPLFRRRTFICNECGKFKQIKL